MGLFDSLFGSSSKKTSNETTNTTQSTTGQQTQQNQVSQEQTTGQQQSSTSNVATQSTSSQQQTQAGSSVVSALDAQTTALLKNILGDFAGNISGVTGGSENAEALKKISSDLYDKASGGNAAAVKKAVDASTEAAKLDYQVGRGTQIAGITQQIGSTGNTYAQLLKQQGENDLATKIANIAATGELQALQLNSQDLGAAADALVQASGVAGTDVNTGLNPVLAIVELLKGAQTTSSNQSTSQQTGQTNTTSTETQIAEMLNKLFGTQTGSSSTQQSGTLSSVSNTTGTSKQKDSQGIIKDILSIF